MADFLTSMAEGSARRATAARRREPETTLRRRVADRPPTPALSLHPAGFDLFAEIKRRGPSTGAAAGHEPDLARRQADAYVRAGVAAVSVLTEPEVFGGTLADLDNAARAVPVPVMRKDFLVDPYQVVEARAHGAGGVLLIARMLDDRRLGEMLAAAAEMRLFVLLEAFDDDDAIRAVQAAGGSDRPQLQLLVGINTRDLATLRVDPGRLDRLARRIPPGLTGVAESGLSTEDDARQVATLGFDVALVGTALMRAGDPTALAAALIAAGRDEKVKACASG